MASSTTTAAPLKKLPALPKIAREPRPIKIPRMVVRPLGPRIYKLNADPRRLTGGPGEPPEGFVGAHTSAEEWIYYWAIAKVLGDPKNPRLPPYAGGRDWDYQSDDPLYGGRVSGGQVMDYSVTVGTKVVGIRLQTERWHVMASSGQQAKDFYLKTHLTGVDSVMDVFTQYGIADTSGRTACEQIARALKGQQEPDPLRLGTAQRVRI